MRVAKCLLKLFVIHIILFIFSLNSSALEKPTHKVINEYIAENTINEFSFDQYMKIHLGFQEGWKKFFNNKMVSQWLGYGGRAEDEPYLLRSLRHFHNPLETWDEAGLWGTFESSVIWGQRTDQSPGGHYS